MTRLKAIFYALALVVVVFLLFSLASFETGLALLNRGSSGLIDHSQHVDSQFHHRRWFRGFGRGSPSTPKMPTLPPKGAEIRKTCQTSGQPCTTSDPGSPLIYFITPTYPRREQAAELTRLAQTLLHVPNLHWVLAEDIRDCSSLIPTLVERYGIPYTYIVSPLPEMYKRLPKKESPRGVSSRRAALNKILEWHNQTTCADQQAVVYFGDDDNTYDLRLFDEIRWTQRVSVFPVGLIGYAMSSPIVQTPTVEGGKPAVVGFSDPWFERRKFPLDMAGFAVSVRFIITRGSNASMPYWVGHEEDEFLKSLNINLGDLEPKANNCGEVLVWHTKTVSEKRPNLVLRASQYPDSNLPELMNSMSADGAIATGQPAGFEVLTCDEPLGCDTRKPHRVVRG